MAIIDVSSAAQLTTALGTTATHGDTVRLAPGTYNAPAGGFLCPKQIEIQGAHNAKSQLVGGSKIVCASANDHGLVIQCQNVSVKDIIVRGPRNAAGDAVGTGNGIHLQTQIRNFNTHSNTTVDNGDTAGFFAGQAVSGSGIPAGAFVSSVTNSTTFVLSAAATSTLTGTPLTFSGGTMTALVLKDCVIWGAGNDGLNGNVGGSLNAILIEDCTIAMNGHHGVYIKDTHAGNLNRVFCHTNKFAGTMLENSSGFNVIGSSWESNWTTAGTTDFDGQVYVKDGWGHYFAGCLWEVSGRICLSISNHDGAHIAGCRFQGADRGIVLRNGSRGTAIAQNSWRTVTTKFDVEGEFTTIGSQRFLERQADPP